MDWSSAVPDFNPDVGHTESPIYQAMVTHYGAFPNLGWRQVKLVAIGMNKGPDTMTMLLFEVRGIAVEP